MKGRQWLVARALGPTLVIALGIGLFAPTLDAPFTGDDVLVVLETPQIYDPAVLKHFLYQDFTRPVPDGVAVPDEGHSSSGLYRPMLLLTYVLDGYLYGQKPLGWRLTNLLLHLVASLLVMAVVRELLQSTAALIAGLLFVATPVHVESVASCLAGRSEMLACIFVLAAWRLFLAADSAPPRRRRALDSGSAFLFLLALWSKENAAVLPGILGLCGWCLRRQSLRVLARRMLPHAVVLVGYVAFRLHVVGRVAPADWSLFFGDAGALQIATTMMAAMATYLRLAVIPHPLMHPNCYARFPETVSTVERFGATALVVGLVAWALWATVRARRTDRVNMWAICVLLFYGCLVPVSHIIPFRAMMAVRFLYLPSVALMLLAGHLARRFEGSSRRWLLGAFVAVLALYSVGTTAANRVWVDVEKFYGELIECDPDSKVAYNNLGTHELRTGSAQAALAHFDRAVQLAPSHFRSHYNKGLALQKLGRVTEAEQSYERALRHSPRHAQSLNNLGLLNLDKGNVDRAIWFFEEVIRVDPTHPAAFVNLANLQQRRGQYAEAEKNLRLAIAMAPRSLEARFNLGRLLEATDRNPEAMASYREALVHHPDHAMSRSNLGRLLANAEQHDEALLELQAAVKVDAECVEAHFNLATLLLVMKRPKEAIPHFEAASRLKPQAVGNHLGLAMALMHSGQPERAETVLRRATKLAPDNARVRALLGRLGKGANATTAPAVPPQK